MDDRTRPVPRWRHAVPPLRGADRVGLGLSPHSSFNDMAVYDETVEQYVWAAEQLCRIGLVHLHLVLGAERKPEATVEAIRNAFGGPLILNGGFDRDRAEAEINAGKADLIAFGIPFIANPDLVERMEIDSRLSAPRTDFFYTPGPEGYVDYQPQAS